MDPRLLFVLVFVAIRVLGVINRQRKNRQSTEGEMSDLSGTNSNPMNPMNRRRTGRAQPKTMHKRDPDNPFDGMHGDVTQTQLTMDDIVTK